MLVGNINGGHGAVVFRAQAADMTGCIWYVEEQREMNRKAIKRREKAHVASLIPPSMAKPLLDASNFSWAILSA